MDYALLIISLICIGLKSVFAKKSNRYINEKHSIYAYNFYMFFIAFVIMTIFGLPNWNGLGLFTATLAILYGVFLFLAQVLLIKAMSVGDTSVSTFFYSCGFLLPIFLSVFLYGEAISVMQGAGIILLLISFFISVEKKAKATKKWFVYVLLALLCNGMVGSIQKIFGMSDFAYRQSSFMIVSFLAGTLVAAIFMKKHEFSIPQKGFLKVGLGSGVTLGIVNTINVYISGALPGVIVFPSVNGGGIIASALLARVMVAERLSTRKKMGIVVGVIAICLIAF